MPSPTFELFEDICKELYLHDDVVLTNDYLSDDKLGDLQAEYRQLSPDAAFNEAVLAIQKHFKQRGSHPPFTYDRTTRVFRVRDKAYMQFVAEASSMRGIPTKSRAFEEATCSRLLLRGAGVFHRVGWPRSRNKDKKSFNSYLQALGFNKKIIIGKEKDGGLDILWLLPLGAVPYQAVISFQCKNGSFDQTTADTSYSPTLRSLACHRRLQPTVHTVCVVFNDYIDKRLLWKKPNHFMVMGLSDLAQPRPSKKMIL